MGILECATDKYDACVALQRLVAHLQALPRQRCQGSCFGPQSRQGLRVDGGEHRAHPAELDRAPRVLRSCMDRHLLPHAVHSFGAIGAQAALTKMSSPRELPYVLLRGVIYTDVVSIVLWRRMIAGPVRAPGLVPLPGVSLGTPRT